MLNRKECTFQDDIQFSLEFGWDILNLDYNLGAFLHNESIRNSCLDVVVD